MSSIDKNKKVKKGKKVKGKKTTTTKTSTKTVVETPVVKTTATKTPVVKTTATKTPVVKTTATKTPVVKTTATETPVVKTTATETPVVGKGEDTNILLADLISEGDNLNKKHKTLLTTLKRLIKLHNKECKDTLKNAQKNKKKISGNVKRTPSGFAKPTKISDALCDFLGIKHGELMARTEVTKRVTKYIREENLQVETNKRQFKPDGKLSLVLGPLDSTKKDKHGVADTDKGYTYFNLQRYLSPQFPKSVTKVV